MKSKIVSLSSVGVTPWVPLDYRQNPFSVSLGVDLDSAASGITYTVQHTFDDPGKKIVPASITRSGTTVTVTFLSAHDLNTGDSIIVEGSGVNGMDGYFTVTVSTTTVLTYTSSISGTATGNLDTRIVTFRVFPHATLAAQTAAGDGNYAFPVQATRLNVTAYSAGKASLIVNQA